MLEGKVLAVWEVGPKHITGGSKKRSALAVSLRASITNQPSDLVTLTYVIKRKLKGEGTYWYRTGF